MISIIQDGRLMDMVSDFALRRGIYTSGCESALFISSGLAFFHCWMVFAGKISASFAANGQDTGLLPFKKRLMVDLWYPKSFIFLSVCSLMARNYQGNRELSTSFLQFANFFYLSSANLYIMVNYDNSKKNSCAVAAHFEAKVGERRQGLQ
jgi:hypothetical protein